MENPPERRWNWVSAILLLLMFQAATARLVVTHWTDFLFFTQTLAALGLALGLALGYSIFKRRAVILLALGYSLTLLPWQMSLAIEDELLSRRLASVGGRLYFSAVQFFQREPVEDSLLFVAFISIVVWIISLVSGYWWTRHENYLAAVLPGGIFILVIHLYDQFFSSRIWILAIYLFLAILLLGQLYYIKNRESWRKRRVFQMQESTFDFTRGMVISATLFIIVAWTFPATHSGFESAIRTWNQLTGPWEDVQEWFSNAVESLEAPVIRRSGELFSNQLGLGLGNPLAETVVFSVEAPDLEEKPPRYYWRGYVYDFYQNHTWYATEAILDEFTPSNTELIVPETGEQFAASFTIRTQISQSLLYIATQPLWVSRPGVIEYAQTDAGEQDLLAWRAEPRLLPGEQFQVTAAFTNPSMQQLQIAGTQYPQWVADRYLQLPEDFSPRITELADQITQEMETPYDKAVAITSYLRNEIIYTNPLTDSPPEGADLLEWILFDLKKGFCNYYATIEVLMLRSVGVPARMAGGFAQGAFDDEANAYIVRSQNEHAWPEVYFPEYGWVEFEPTGNQDPLLRPNRPEDIDPENPENQLDGFLNQSGLDPIEDLPERKLNFEEDFGDTGALPPIEEQLAATTTRILYPVLGALLIGLLWLLNRQYAVFDRIPVRLQTAYERNGGRSPAWLKSWVHWARLTPIERSFETINRSLRLLGRPPAYSATPAERAQALAKELPVANSAIESLLEQHQASLFTPEPGHPGLARRASLTIWVQTIRSIVEKFLYGRPVQA
ncbi:MAG: transglutaminaseTgpA domain-containing protein [Anaerolineales bacterium]